MKRLENFSVKGRFDHPYPTTRILWIPDSVCVEFMVMTYCMVTVSYISGINIAIYRNPDWKVCKLCARDFENLL